MARTNPPEPVTTGTDHEVTQHIVNCEIARLDRKFLVTSDPTLHPGSKATKLVCSIIDRNLPSVPGLHVYIPADYPASSPTCKFLEHEIIATPFFGEMQRMFELRITKLPAIFSLSYLLDTWEMAIRHACSPNNNPDLITATSVALGV